MTMSFQQEPSGDGAEIMNAIQHVRPGNMFEPNFMISARSGHDYTTHAQTLTLISVRSDVNGAGRLPLYSWVLARCDSPVPTLSNPQMLYYSPLSVEDVRWNFEKVTLLFT